MMPLPQIEADFPRKKTDEIYGFRLTTPGSPRYSRERGGGLTMRLNADIIYHDLKDVLDVAIYGMCENDFALFRPEFYLDGTPRFRKNHVYVCSADHLPDDPVIEDNVLLICLGEAPQREKFEKRCGVLSISGKEDIFRVFNIVQGIFNKYEAWEAEISRILRQNASPQALLDASKEILGNPMLLIGADFSYLAYTESEYLTEKLGIRLDSPTFDPDLLDVFLSLHELATDIKEPLLLSLMGRSTLSVNLFEVDDYLGCITVFGEFREFRSSDIQLCQFLAENLRQAFLLKPHLAGDRSSLRSVIRQLVRGEPLGLEQRGLLRKHGDRGEELCVVFRPAPDSNPLPSGYISSLIEEQYRDALAFEDEGRIVAVLPRDQGGLTLLGSLAQKLRLICGISRPFRNLQDSAYACYQASSALNIGYGIDPERCVYRFEDYILPLLLRNATAELPARIFYSEGLSRLAAHDETSPVSYIDTLKTYLDNNMSIAETARKMNLHRSSLIDRLERITQILGGSLEDPEQRLAAQIVLSAERRMSTD